MTRLTRCEMTSARFGPNAKCCTHISWTSEREGVMCAVWRDAVTLTVTPDACQVLVLFRSFSSVDSRPSLCLPPCPWLTPPWPLVPRSCYGAAPAPRSPSWPSAARSREAQRQTNRMAASRSLLFNQM